MTDTPTPVTDAGDIDWDALDYDNPAALLKIFRPLYYKLLAEGAEEEVQVGPERVRFGRRNLKEVKALVDRLELQVDASRGRRRRRFSAVSRF